MRDQLIDGLQRLNIEAGDTQIDLLLAYVNLLVRWNQAYNLTAIRDPNDMLRLHILDSLSVLWAMEGEDCLDVGTGGGLPGIPLAIFRPDITFTLLDSNGKKTRFVTQAAIELGLSNAKAVHSRIEEHTATYSQVISRAFRDWERFAALCWSLVGDQGRLLAMLGQAPSLQSVELSEHFPKNVYSAAIHSLQVPGIDAARHLMVLEKQT
ncbi:MAG: 16S rRNA (guanine(527)-N(7))-methyltransferase RsmG [Gammaproteobacteria bacterium]|nr:16S rRNA (guanine(527)-N(7))-methyltransferase RsmG [Gammaproteobacteria bacterium]